MSFQTPLTIKEAIENIENNKIEGSVHYYYFQQ